MDLLKIIEANPKIAEHIGSLVWLTSPKNRAEGRTTALAIAFIINSINNPGPPIPYWDHCQNENSKERMKSAIEKISEGELICDRRNIMNYRRNKSYELGDMSIEQGRNLAGVLISCIEIMRKFGVDYQKIIDDNIAESVINS